MIVQIKILSSNGIALLFPRGIFTARERDPPRASQGGGLAFKSHAQIPHSICVVP